MGYMHDTKQFTLAGYAIIAATLLLGLLVEAMLRSESNLRSLVGAVLSVSILAIGLALALNLGQRR